MTFFQAQIQALGACIYLSQVVWPVTPFLRHCAQNEPAKGQKSSDNKRVRIDKEALEKLLFTLFEKKDNYNFADLMVQDLTISVQSAWPAVHKYTINKATLCHTAHAIRFDKASYMALLNMFRI
eukprot:scaffold164108_cov20-Prasinocladus_malaysianus.AAC.1